MADERTQSSLWRSVVLGMGCDCRQHLVRLS